MLFALIAAAVISTTPVLAPFSFQVHAGSAAWTVEPVGFPEDESHFELKALRIVERGSPDRLIQEIELKSPEVLYTSEGWVEAEDFDFDGYLDLYVTTMGGSGGTHGFVMRYNPKKNIFLKPYSLPNADPDPKRRVIRTGWRFGYCCGWDNEVRFVPGQFEPVILKSVDRSRADDSGSPIIKTVEERDAKGKMKVVCRIELEDSVEQPVQRVLEGDLKRCLHEGEP